MPRPQIDDVFDFDSPVVQRQVAAALRGMKGLNRVTVKPVRETRSTRANGYYFAAVVTPFFEFLRDQDERVTSREQAHIELKRQVLGTVAVRIGNVVSRIVPDTHDMDSATFADYVDRCRAFLSNQVGIETLDPSEYG